MRALVLGLLLVATPALACTDPDVEGDIQIAVVCRPFTVQPGTARCRLVITNENQCHALMFSGILGITTTYIPSDPGGIPSGDDLSRNGIGLMARGTRRFNFMVPLDDLSASVDIRVHLVGTQEDTAAPFDVLRTERVYAP